MATIMVKQSTAENSGVSPSPLWGGVRGGGNARINGVATLITPLPNPPPT
jgi:hypothetical protein